MKKLDSRKKHCQVLAEKMGTTRADNERLRRMCAMSKAVSYENVVSRYRTIDEAETSQASFGRHDYNGELNKLFSDFQNLYYE